MLSLAMSLGSLGLVIYPHSIQYDLKVLKQQFYVDDILNKNKNLTIIK